MRSESDGPSRFIKGVIIEDECPLTCSQTILVKSCSNDEWVRIPHLVVFLSTIIKHAQKRVVFTVTLPFSEKPKQERKSL